jgi:23S rRNA (guanine745-N1)-methyltransferase
MARLLCTVRGCGIPLQSTGRTVGCARGHSFDVASSGYVNLLQPQDRRSKHPGDSREASQARRRLAHAGREDWLLSEVLAEVDALPPAGERPRIALDVGCGEGFLAGSLAQHRAVEASGIDLSVPAVELAARRYPACEWVVGNADRFLPWEDGAFDFVTSVTARRNASEMRRVLAPGGRVLVVVPAEDDLIELREALLGRATRRDRTAAAIQDLGPDLTLVSRRGVRQHAFLDRSSLRDLLLATYRGSRTSQEKRAAALEPMTVTFSRELLLFRAARDELAPARGM